MNKKNPPITEAGTLDNMHKEDGHTRRHHEKDAVSGPQEHLRSEMKPTPKLPRKGTNDEGAEQMEDPQGNKKGSGDIDGY